MASVASLKAIANTVNGEQPARITRIIAELCAQVLDMRINSALIALKIITQDLLDKLHTCVHATRIASKGGEQLKL